MHALLLDLYVRSFEQLDFSSNARCDENTCYLGKWLKQGDSDLLNLTHLQNLLDRHEEFHVVVAEMLKQHQTGNRDSSLEILTTAFKNTSSAVLAAIEILADEHSGRALRQATAPRAGSGSLAVTTVTLGDAFRIGVPVIDEQHQILIELLGRLRNNSESDVGVEKVGEIMSQIFNQIIEHFETEEMYMRTCGMPADEFERHCEGHSTIVEEYVALQYRTMNDAPSKVKDVIEVLETWIMGHVFSNDFQIRKYVK